MQRPQVIPDPPLAICSELSVWRVATQNCGLVCQPPFCGMVRSILPDNTQIGRSHWLATEVTGNGLPGLPLPNSKNLMVTRTRLIESGNSTLRAMAERLWIRSIA